MARFRSYKHSHLPARRCCYILHQNTAWTCASYQKQGIFALLKVKTILIELLLVWITTRVGPVKWLQRISPIIGANSLLII